MDRAPLASFALVALSPLGTTVGLMSALEDRPWRRLLADTVVTGALVGCAIALCSIGESAESFDDTGDWGDEF